MKDEKSVVASSLEEFRGNYKYNWLDRNFRAFHAEVLGEGSLPLDVLEARIDRWIAARKAG